MCVGVVSFFKDCIQNLSIIEYFGNRVKLSVLYVENLNMYVNVNLYVCCLSCLFLVEIEMKIMYIFFIFVKSIN